MNRGLGFATTACALLLLFASNAWSQTEPSDSGAPPVPSGSVNPQLPPPALPPVPKDTSIETAGPTATSPSRSTTPMPATARTLTGDVPLGGAKLRAKAGLPPLKWDDRKWARFGAIDLVVSGVFGTVGVVAAIIPPIKGNRRSGPILADRAVRDAIHIDEPSARFSARDASDSILSLLLTYPVFIDSIATAWWLRGNADVARQIALIDLEAMAITVGLQGATNVMVARERPYGAECGTSVVPGEVNDCTRSRRYRSFFSGHAAQAFTAAGLICYHHMKLRLLGSGPADALTCASGMVAAGAVATLRVVGDMHYASDVTIGAGVGTLVGLGIPFLHYHGLPTVSFTAKTGTTTASLVPSGMGLAIVGSF